MPYQNVVIGLCDVFASWSEIARLLICKLKYYLLLRFSQKHLFRVWLTVANISKMSILLCRWYCWVSSLVYWLTFAFFWETPLCSAFVRSWRHFFTQAFKQWVWFFVQFVMFVMVAQKKKGVWNQTRRPGQVVLISTQTRQIKQKTLCIRKTKEKSAKDKWEQI